MTIKTKEYSAHISNMHGVAEHFAASTQQNNRKCLPKEGSIEGLHMIYT